MSHDVDDIMRSGYVQVSASRAGIKDVLNYGGTVFLYFPITKNVARMLYSEMNDRPRIVLPGFLKRLQTWHINLCIYDQNDEITFRMTYTNKEMDMAINEFLRDLVGSDQVYLSYSKT